MFAWVYESDTLEALCAGELRGRWCFGYAQGVCVGSLVWLAREAHVVRLIGDVSAVCWRGSCSSPPWVRYVAGAPKKVSRRGAHFRLGNHGHIQSTRWFGTNETGAVDDVVCGYTALAGASVSDVASDFPSPSRLACNNGKARNRLEDVWFIASEMFDDTKQKSGSGFRPRAGGPFACRKRCSEITEN